MTNFLVKNQWKVASTHEWDDSMQEARFVFVKLAATYPLVESPAHFMGLFKTAWYNHFVDLAAKSTEARRLVSENREGAEDGESFAFETPGELDNYGMLLTMIEQAPSDVKAVLALFINAPSELLDHAMSAWRDSGRYRADGDAFVSKMLGLPTGSRPIAAVYEYFSVARG